jgi:hypothetical protein
MLLDMVAFAQQYSAKLSVVSFSQDDKDSHNEAAPNCETEKCCSASTKSATITLFRYGYRKDR